MPHRDTGAGNGQSNSLIVTLGDFAGGGVYCVVLCCVVCVHCVLLCVCVIVLLCVCYGVCVCVMVCEVSVYVCELPLCSDDLSVYSPN